MSSNNSTATGSSSRANSNTDLEPEVYEPLQKLPPLEAEFKTILKHPLVTTPSKGLPTPKLADEIVEIWVTQEERVSLFINYLSDLTQIGKVVLSLDCEGNNLGRDGTLSQVTLNLAAAGLTYHLDHTVLSKQLWKTQGRYGHTLKIFLEDPNIPILIYDVRGDSDGIHHHSGIVLGGVIDIQLMAIAYNAVTQGWYRHGGRLPGLALCIANDIGLSSNELTTWLKGKNEGKKYCETHGWKAYDERPLPEVLKKYAAGDVIYLPHLYAAYYEKLQHYPKLMDWVMRESNGRVMKSTSPEYDPKLQAQRLVPGSFLELDDSCFANGSLKSKGKHKSQQNADSDVAGSSSTHSNSPPKERTPESSSSSMLDSINPCSGKPRPKFNNEEIQRLSKEGLCFFCKKPNHMVDNCPAADKAQEQKLKPRPAYASKELQTLSCQGRCFNCRGMGHLEQDCPTKQERVVTCWHCNQTGHVATKCPNKHN